MAHVVLLGDSIFDNAPYVDAGESVSCCLERKLPLGWRSTLLAIDGSVTLDVLGQVEQVPRDGTHLFLSVGGNDALQASEYLHRSVSSVEEVMLGFSRIIDDFRGNYVSLVDFLVRRGVPLTLCTIYNPCFERGEEQTIAVMALMFWNDVILQTAIGYGLPVVELRRVFTGPADYANPIEPSGVGADKLADAILTVVRGHDFAQVRSSVYGVGG
ncbi:MAG: SGNH/GDSL hydrolase family protein [Prochlorothrix sp.]